MRPNLEQYAESFYNYGYEDSGVLEEATEEDIQEVMDEIGMKKGHRRLLLNAMAALAALRGTSGSGGGGGGGVGSGEQHQQQHQMEHQHQVSQHHARSDYEYYWHADSPRGRVGSESGGAPSW